MEDIRLTAFLVLFVLFFALERFIPHYKKRDATLARYVSNLGMIGLANALILLLIPILPFAAALALEESGLGLLPLLGFEGIFGFILGFLILDCTIYWQHRFFHKIPFFWRFHKVHHIDLDLDVSTGVRFHPVEILLSILIKLAVITLFGISAEAVLAFEVVLNATSLFTHANIKIPSHIDRRLRLFIVTPDMHLIHHSIKMDESNRNFGFNFSFWDRLFESYKHTSVFGEFITLGIDTHQDREANRFFSLMLVPFR